MPHSPSKPSVAGAASYSASTEGKSEPVCRSEPLLANAGVTWIFVLLVAALGSAFWLYTQPDLVVMLAEQLWACF